MICKICGKDVEMQVRYLCPESKFTICPEHSKYCNTKCNIASKVKGWHFEPCLSCEHNPYKEKCYG